MPTHLKLIATPLRNRTGTHSRLSRGYREARSSGLAEEAFRLGTL